MAVGKSAMKLQNLLAIADADLSEAIDNSIMAQVMAVGGDISDFNPATDSLEAISNAIGAIPCTDAVAEIGSFTGQTNLQTLLAALGIPDVTAKGLYTCLVTDRLDSATFGLSALQVDISAIPTTMVGTNGAAVASVWTAGLATNIGTTNTSVANGTYGLSALETLITAIPTTMVGTNLAFTAAVGGELDTTEHSGAVDGTTMLMGYTKQIVTDAETLTTHTLLYTGATAYANVAKADDTGDGTTPGRAKKTIAAAQVVAGIGGAVTVMAGTYVEDVVMSYASQEMHFEIGAVLAGTGTCLTVSGGACKVVGPVKITPAADQIGVLVSTVDGNQFEGVRVKGSAAVTGWKFEIGGTICRECSGAGIKSGGACFDIQGNGTKLHHCYAAGTTTSYGFFVDGTITQGFLSGCISVGNQTSGFYLDGVSAMSVIDCSSGSGDGAAVDVDNANAWCDFCFDGEVFKSNVLSVAGGGGTSEYNLYQLTGAVKVIGIFADVEVALTGTNTDCFLQLSSTNGDVEISKDDAGVTLGALGVGSVIMRLDKEDKVLVVGDVTLGPALIDQTDVKEEGFRIIQDRKAGADVPTFIQFVHTCADAGTGTLHWHVTWEPVGEGFLKAV